MLKRGSSGWHLFKGYISDTIIKHTLILILRRFIPFNYSFFFPRIKRMEYICWSFQNAQCFYWGGEKEHEKIPRFIESQYIPDKTS